MDAHQYPKLRSVEVHPSSTHPGAFDVTDPTGIATGRLTLSDGALFVVSLMDGRRQRADIQAEFIRQRGTMLFSDDLDQMIRQLDEAWFLAGPGFDAHLAELTARYRAAPFRAIRDKGSFDVPMGQIGEHFDKMLRQSGSPAGTPADSAGETGARRVVGLVAPHLDYRRGAPCYGLAYARLAERTDATRFIILGTNHFGRSSAVVGTRKDFESADGVVPHDADFMRRLDVRCGQDLCELEYDHVREHSIELQVLLLRHVLGDRPVTIAPYLCPDPCGPTGTAPYDAHGADLKDFALALRAEIEADNVPTCLIAGADLSHVGRYFQDNRDLDADTLHAVEASDRRALDLIVADDPEGLRARITATANATSICSIGCLYVLGKVLQGQARPRFLGYHQALTREAENCVTCAALEYVAN